MTITFFGHKNTTVEIKPLIRKIIIDLIEKNNATCFYVGNHGNFDSMVTQVLKELSTIYPDITYFTVLAYLPTKQQIYYQSDDNTFFPEGFENVPRRFAICKRNEWMVKNSDAVVTYVDHDFGGAYKYKMLAEKKEKIIIELTNVNHLHL